MAKVLVVEDTPYNAELLAYHLVHEGFEVLTASTGQDALEQAREQVPDVILLDFAMPEMDGVEVCRRIKGIPQLRVIPILVMSAKAEEDEVVRGLDAGAQDYITKPINVRILLARVRAAARAKTDHDKMSRLSNRLSRLSSVDHLTGLASHGHFQEALAAHTSVAVRQQAALSLVFLNLDEFSAFNREFGHAAGDQVLESVGQILLRNIRQSDVAARYGGDEFALLLPSVEAAAGGAAAERLRAQIESFPWPFRGITASAGVATTSGQCAQAPELEAEAGQALEHAKRNGRNLVIHHDVLKVKKSPLENGVAPAAQSHSGN